MKPLFAVAVLACLLLTSCSSVRRDVSLAALDEQLKTDTKIKAKGAVAPVTAGYTSVQTPITITSTVKSAGLFTRKFRMAYIAFAEKSLI